jgi:hypothetical protein
MATDILNPEKEFDLVYGFKEQISASDHVVLLNHPDVFRLMYYPYIADYHGFVLPRSLRSMGYAQNDLRVKRLAQFTYELAPEGGFLLHPKDLPVSSTTKPHSLRYAVFFDDGAYSFSENDQIQFPEMTIHIRQVSEMHRPLVVNVELSQEKSPVLLYWDSLTKQHKRLPSLLVGETFFIPAAQ